MVVASVAAKGGDAPRKWDGAPQLGRSGAILKAGREGSLVEAVVETKLEFIYPP